MKNTIKNIKNGKIHAIFMTRYMTNQEKASSKKNLSKISRGKSQNTYKSSIILKNTQAY